MVTDEVLTPSQAVGFISSGLFNLNEDEALILNLKLMGTRYVRVITYRPFIVSPEHVYSSSSLNNFQTRPNPGTPASPSLRHLVRTDRVDVACATGSQHSTVSGRANADPAPRGRVVVPAFEPTQRQRSCSSASCRSWHSSPSR